MVLEITQSTPLCIVLSAVGGAIEVLATAVLAYRDAHEREFGQKWHRTASTGALAVNVFLQVTSSMIGSLVAPWFGPVSLVGPVFLCAQLLANMVVMGAVLGLETFNKDMRVGTFVVVTAAVLLPVVGPGAQEYNSSYITDYLMSTWYTVVWSVLMVVGMILAAVLLLALDVNRLAEWSRMALLLIARATAFTVNLTVSKIMVLGVDQDVLWLSIVLKIASGLVITYALIVQATAVPQNTFIPLNASALILVNAITGLLIWQDWRVVGDWVGYACVFVQLILGNYLLLGDIELLSPENARYGRVKAISMASSRIVDCGCGDGLVMIVAPSASSEEEEGNGGHHPAAAAAAGDAKLSTGKLESSIDAAGRPTTDAAIAEGAYQYWEGGDQARVQKRQSAAAHLRRSSKKEAWSAIYGVDADSSPAHRRRSIFTIDEEDNRKGEF